jgi:cation-transporting ATPase 13A2
LAGYSTAKGELVRMILFPKPMPFKFTQDSFKWIAFLALIALVGMIYAIVVQVTDKQL